MLRENSLLATIKLLAIMVLIDDKLHVVEPKELYSQIINLKIFVDEEKSIVDNVDIELWCAENWKSIQKNLRSVNRNEYIDKALNAISDEHLRPMLYVSMSQIARCDNEYHIKEKELLNRASKIWDLG